MVRPWFTSHGTYSTDILGTLMPPDNTPPAVTDADRARAAQTLRFPRPCSCFSVDPPINACEDGLCEDAVKAIAHALAEQRERFEKPYMELIMAVSRKCPNESRHQTALRYIQSCETGGNERTATAAIRRGEP